MSDVKICSHCKEEKLVTGFNKNKGRRDGLSHVCRECAKDFNKSYYDQNKEYHQKTVRKSYLRRNFGLTEEEYEQMFNDQQGKCAICRSETKQRLSIDHCHQTGKLRRLLCSPCNLMLGNAQDNPAILRAGADYLERMNDPDLERQVVPQTLMEFQFV